MLRKQVVEQSIKGDFFESSERKISTLKNEPVKLNDKRAKAFSLLASKRKTNKLLNKSRVRTSVPLWGCVSKKDATIYKRYSLIFRSAAQH